MDVKQQRQHSNSAYDRGREDGFAALLERRNPSLEWFRKAGRYNARRLYTEKSGPFAHFMNGWMSNWNSTTE